MYVKWAVGKCPAIACRTFLAPRNQRSKSVNSFAGHPVLCFHIVLNLISILPNIFSLDLISARWDHFLIFMIFPLLKPFEILK